MPTTKEQPTVHVTEKIPVIEERLAAKKQGQAIIHYMADLYTINKSNPHTVSNTPALSGATPADYLLHHPDSWGKSGLDSTGKPKKNRSKEQEALETVCAPNRDISLIEWLKLKFSKIAWENDGNYRDIIPRSALAILIEGDKQKIAVVNAFLSSIDPYHATEQQKILKKSPQDENVALSEDVSCYWNVLRYPYLGALYVGQVLFHMLSYIPGFHSIKDIVNALTVGCHKADVDDFTTTMFTRLVYMHQDEPEKLSEETKQHMLDHLLKHEGSVYNDTIPNTGFAKYIAALVGYPITEKGIQNTENHLLMINGSAYLKNQLVKNNLNHGSELEYKLCAHLDNILENGLTEFNSIPYSGYTVDALLNLHDFAEEPVKSRATRVLDKIFYDYAIHSTHDGKSFRPIARQILKRGNRAFMKDDAIRAFMMTWLDKDSNYYRTNGTCRNAMFAFTAAVTTYRPPEIVCDLAKGKTKGYLAITGLPHGNAEVSYKNHYKIQRENAPPVQRQYLLSGGGVTLGRGKIKEISEDFVTRSDYLLARNSWFNSNPRAREEANIRVQRTAAEVISRNPVLILDGKKTHTLEQSFYLGTDVAIQDDKGPGYDSRGKNNSGIYFDTMVGAYPVHVPEQYKGKGIKPEQDGLAQCWTLYRVDKSLHVAVFDGEVPFKHEQKQLGIVMVLPGDISDPQQLINRLAEKNQKDIQHTVRFPEQNESIMAGKTVHYDPYAPLDRYVIRGVDNTEWLLENRLFASMPGVKQGDDASPGWSSGSVIQESPNERPMNHLSTYYADTNAYDFLSSEHPRTTLAR